jgi:hypothetical protein
MQTKTWDYNKEKKDMEPNVSFEMLLNAILDTNLEIVQVIPLRYSITKYNMHVTELTKAIIIYK